MPRTACLAAALAALALGGCNAQLQAEAVFERACRLDATAQLDAASAAYWDSIAIWPTSRAANNLGVLHARRGQLDDARRWFQFAVNLPGDDVIARTNLGVVLYHLGRVDEARAALREARQARRTALARGGGTGRVDWDVDRYAETTRHADEVAARYLDRDAGPAAARPPRLAESLVFIASR
jgi:tetratricopeptide (TPR) repeat protein